jgi:hypothetical protein
MMPRKEDSRPSLSLEVRRAQAGSPGPRQAGRTWEAFLAALLRALSVAGA